MKHLKLLAATISESEINKIIEPILTVANAVINPLITIVGALGAIWCIFLGIKFATAEDPQEHEKVKKTLKNSIIGFILIFVLLIMLRLAVKYFTNWYATQPITAV